MSRERTRPERSYGEDEVAEILQRAAGLESQRKLERPALSLAEIEAIARDSGIDPGLVRRAARELEQHRGEKSLGARLAGAPLQRVVEREVEGELGPEVHEVLAGELRAAFGGSSMTMGQVSTVGRTLAWTGYTRGGLVELTVFPREGKTVIRAQLNSAGAAAGLFGGLMGGVGGGLGANVAWMVPSLLQLPWYTGAAAALGVVGFAWGLARTLFAGSANGMHRRLEAVVDTLEARLRAPKR